ncbi:translation repressor RelB [Arabiibacter massiliensis]|uniref:translation repressor RelB n=1 Tax=Arabiibacter massiliensis TaxID=1870985 RepID=UPI0009BA4327|nr:translation repressor RelB [Arabiibacter massiliensis]
MASDTVQMNTRIGRALKDNGDAALERAGYSPSQAVRKLWEFAARNAHNPRAIQNLLEDEDEAARSEAEEERARRREVALRGANIMAEAYERLGITPSDWTKNASYEEMRDYALLERLRERGLDG